MTQRILCRDAIVDRIRRDKVALRRYGAGDSPQRGNVSFAADRSASTPTSVVAAFWAAAATESQPPRRYIDLPQTAQCPFKSRPPRRLQTWIAPCIGRWLRQWTQ